MLPFLKRVREARRPRCTALVAAAGSSRRMGGVNKLLQPLEGVPVLVRTLTALQLAEGIDETLTHRTAEEGKTPEEVIRYRDRMFAVLLKAQGFFA